MPRFLSNLLSKSTRQAPARTPHIDSHLDSDSDASSVHTPTQDDFAAFPSPSERKRLPSAAPVLGSIGLSRPNATRLLSLDPDFSCYLSTPALSFTSSVDSDSDSTSLNSPAPCEYALDATEPWVDVQARHRWVETSSSTSPALKRVVRNKDSCASIASVFTLSAAPQTALPPPWMDLAAFFGSVLAQPLPRHADGTVDFKRTLPPASCGSSLFTASDSESEWSLDENSEALDFATPLPTITIRALRSRETSASGRSLRTTGSTRSLRTTASASSLRTSARAAAAFLSATEELDEADEVEVDEASEASEADEAYEFEAAWEAPRVFTRGWDRDSMSDASSLLGSVLDAFPAPGAVDERFF